MKKNTVDLIQNCIADLVGFDDGFDEPNETITEVIEKLNSLLSHVNTKFLVHCHSEDFENSYDLFDTKEDALQWIDTTLINGDFKGDRIVQYEDGEYGVFRGGWEEKTDQECIESGDWSWRIDVIEVLEHEIQDYIRSNIDVER